MEDRTLDIVTGSIEFLVVAASAVALVVHLI